MKRISLKYRTIAVILPLAVLAAGIMASCTEKIDLPLDESFTRLVVEGAISTDTAAHRVKLTTTSSYYFNQPPVPVSGANVIITDGTDTIPLHEAEPGTYLTSADVFGLPGHTYNLQIELASPIGGHTRYEAPAEMTSVNPIDSVKLYFLKEWGRAGIWEVKCFVQEPPGVDFYRFMVFRNHTLLTDTINEWFVTDDKFFDGNYTNGAGVGFINQSNPSEGLVQGDTVMLRVDNISKAFTGFIQEVQTEFRSGNPLFSGPPANVSGNVSNGAIGFFTAFSSAYGYDVVPEFNQGK